VEESFSYDRQTVKNMVRKAWLVLVRGYLYWVVLALLKCVLFKVLIDRLYNSSVRLRLDRSLDEIGNDNPNKAVRLYQMLL